ncbi:MAG: GDP-mannose 4,6-dehydratase [Micavibrio aeruginosavorus]|uniref:GDP-mannose 4,6-dehydratase n=1 Tax=Micavibrio aeruginosavorus TaxID=349221 RepID=A0A7T5R390_9BACT|nr:MAG: GDP-mannose 4,6-dehydratase [Micavibrio aeruginosavorus]
MTKRTILITGAAGFVGHHMVEHILKNTDFNIIGIDSLSYSGSLDRLRDIQIDPFHHPRFTHMGYDFRQPAGPNLIRELASVTHVLHMGAESHVDRSIADPMSFVMANVVGTTNMLELARGLPQMELFIYFSTDEVFGPVPLDPAYPGHQETAVHSPKNPYAATKSSGEQMVTAFANTYGIPCIITRQMNIFGERQHPEKFIPKVIRSVLSGAVVPIHATPDKTQAGMRHYIHARNVADAHMFLLEKRPWIGNACGHVESYHIVGEREVDNLQLALMIERFVRDLAPASGLKVAGLCYEMVDFHSSRPGHDLRYALDGRKMKALGWQPPKNFEESLKKTVQWSLENPGWLSNP